MLVLPPPLPLLTPEAMRAAEARTIATGTPALVLMERASAAAAAAILAFSPKNRALVLAGPGNNGGDGYGVALALAAAGIAVEVAALAPPQTEPAQTMAARWTGPVTTLDAARPAPLLIDALFGTGQNRAMPDAATAALARLAPGAVLAALDIVSNIDAASGAALGPVQAAALTIAFGAAKPGHVLGSGAQATGRLVTADIGIDVTGSGLGRVPRPLRHALAPDIHKYARGHVLVVEGESGGAARLAALAALRAGAGLVTLIGPDSRLPADAIMNRTDADGRALLADPRCGAVVFGPGLAEAERGQAWLARLLGGALPVVLDAGGLALTSPEALHAATAPLVLTPHEGEFRRLFGPLADDRIGAVRAAAAAAGAVVLLKGPQTLIAAPDGRVLVNDHATPWLATAGSGDVLAGMIASLIAQGQPAFEAAATAAWLHGDAGRRGGPGLIADDLPALLLACLAAL
jgi:hydroxyethylthiazole kinase-like uncharacterized protein yjeF